MNLVMDELGVATQGPFPCPKSKINHVPNNSLLLPSRQSPFVCANAIHLNY